MDIRHETSDFIERVKDFYCRYEYEIKSTLVGAGIGIAAGAVYYLGYKEGMKDCSTVVTAGILNKKPELLAEVIDCIDSLSE